MAKTSIVDTSALCEPADMDTMIDLSTAPLPVNLNADTSLMAYEPADNPHIVGESEVSAAWQRRAAVQANTVDTYVAATTETLVGAQLRAVMQSSAGDPNIGAQLPTGELVELSAAQRRFGTATTGAAHAYPDSHPVFQMLLAPYQELDNVAYQRVLSDMGKELIDCPRCGNKGVVAHHLDKHLCEACVKAENARVRYLRKLETNIVDTSTAAGLEPWVQQPGESQWEYTVWCAYRDSYPGKRPSYRSTAEELGTTYAAVSAIAQRWQFTARMGLWMKHIDEQVIATRQQQILAMNDKHIDMAQRANAKLSMAIDAIQPTWLKASEIASLAKLATELENKAHIGAAAAEQRLVDLRGSTSAAAAAQQLVRRPDGSVDRDNPANNAALRQVPAHTAQDMSQIVEVLASAGVLDQLGLSSRLGVRVKETTTTTSTTSVELAGDELRGSSKYEEVLVSE
jgi:ribosomal protein S27AE